MNIIKFYDSLSDVFEQENKALLISTGNYLTAWWLDISDFFNKTFAGITITLKGCDDLDFKTIAGADLYISGDFLYYKGVLSIGSLQGKYYLEISDGTITRYSNVIFFDAAQNYELTGDFTELYTSAGNINMQINGVNSISIDWGDEIVSYNLPATITKTLIQNTIARVFSPQNITEFICNSSLLNDIKLSENLLNIEKLDIADTNVLFDFQSVRTLTYADVSRTPIPPQQRVLQPNPIEIWIGDEIGSIGNSYPYRLYSSASSLKDISVKSNGITQIQHLLFFGSTFTKVENLDFSFNRFITTPKIGLNNANVLVSPIEDWNISNNQLKGEDFNVLSRFLGGVIEKIDLKNNAITSSQIIENILRYVAVNNNTLLYLDISGASPVTGDLMAQPQDGIDFYHIVQGGENYIVDDVLNVTDGDTGGTGSLWRVSEVDVNGAITELSLITRGAGYNAIENFTGGTGTNGIIEFYSPRVYLTSIGMEVYTNATFDVELLPEHNILDAQTKHYLKDEEDYLTWF